MLLLHPVRSTFGVEEQVGNSQTWWMRMSPRPLSHARLPPPPLVGHGAGWPCLACRNCGWGYSHTAWAFVAASRVGQIVQVGEIKYGTICSIPTF